MKDGLWRGDPVLAVAVLLFSSQVSQGLSCSEPTPGMYTIKTGDTYEKIASSCRSSAEDLNAANPSVAALNLQPGSQICVPKQCSSGFLCSGSFSGTYAVKSGETLGKIADGCRIDLAGLTAANAQIKDPSLIVVGQQICVPPNCSDSHNSSAPSMSAASPSTTSPTGTSCTDSSYALYRVKQGDILYNISVTCAVTVQELQANNPGVSPTNMSVGLQICVPRKCSDSSNSTALAPTTPRLPGTMNLQQSGKLSDGAIAGIVVGVIAGLGIAFAALFAIVMRHRRHLHRKVRQDEMSDRWTGNSGIEYTGSTGYNSSSGHSNKIQRQEGIQTDRRGLLATGSLDTGNLSYVPFTEVEVGRGDDAVSMNDINLTEETKKLSSFESLPSRWQIPLASIKLVCCNDVPIELGRGGFGVVLRAVVRKEEAAIKIVKGGGPAEQARLLHELHTLELCKTLHVVQFLGYACSGEELLLCMQYCSGGTLQQALRSSDEFQWYNRGREAMREVTAGLYCLHDMNLMHGDLKSANLLIDTYGCVKIADLGLGKLVLSGREKTETQLGTFEFMAPEQLLFSRASLASDIWALSAIFFEVCTCRRATRMISLDEIRVPEDAPAELVKLISACREAEPSARPTIGEVCETLNSIPRV